MDAFVIGAATTKFGELWGISPRTLARRAFGQVVSDSGINKNRVEALFVGNMLSGILGGQEHLGALFAEELGLSNVPAFHIEGACASGGLAVHAAVNAVLSGQYKTVGVLGIEKMTDYKPEVISQALMGAGSDEERTAGVTFPGLYAILARAYMRKFEVSEKELAAVSVKNHFHASLNPNAQFRNVLKIEDVLKSALVADPLRLLECSPVSDGASALIISGVDSKNGIEIIASEVATDSLGLSERESLTELKATQIAVRKAYEKSGLGPKDIDIAEVHDCFSIAEILALEDLGFFEKGKAGKMILNEKVTLGKSKHMVVNTSGGLKGAGHPVGATGVKQIVEIVDQLKGRAGLRQVDGAKVGLTQNIGGSGATAVVHILKKHDKSG
jgi:acetyl-CoA C-acetyltransferase